MGAASKEGNKRVARAQRSRRRGRRYVLRRSRARQDLLDGLFKNLDGLS